LEHGSKEVEHQASSSGALSTLRQYQGEAEQASEGALCGITRERLVVKGAVISTNRRYAE